MRGDHSRIGDDRPDPDNTGGTSMNIGREPALLATSLLAPAVGTLLLFLTDLPAGAQAGWNAAAVAIAGLITAVVAQRDRLAPAILGFAQAILALLTVYGLGMTAEQATGVMAFLALVVGAFVRTQVAAPVTVDGEVLHSRAGG